MKNNDLSELVPPVDDPEFEEAFRFFCRHLVSLSGWYYSINSDGKSVGGLQFFSYSGFIFSVRDNWCWATAGHVLEELERHLANGDIRVKRFVLVDYFGNNVASYDPIPFVYETAPKFFIHDSEAGLDFGLIGLAPYYRNLLEANGIVSVREENWVHQHKVEFGHHFILGLPNVFIETKMQASERGKLMTATLWPTMIDVTKLDNPPGDLLNTKFPRFIGKLKDDFPLDDIVGMSGGPVIGFSKEGDRYWVVAIQSSKLNSSDLDRDKIVFACPVPVFATLVENLLSESEFDD